ncbi:PAB2 [Symbiodinium sp. CCMP2456]|nr:PAB2 [Symbiodinium sp. CCMP2456]
MLEKQAAALEQATTKQSSSDERIEQLKRSLDMAHSEAARARAKYEDDLRTTRWVVDRVTRLELLVDQLRNKDAAIRQELGIDPEHGIWRAAAGNDADSVAPPVEPHVLSPENPGHADEGYDDEWWGERHANEYVGLGGAEKGYFQWDALGHGASPEVEVKIPQPAFKLLKDAPKLDLSAGGEPWEVGMTVHQWRVETRAVLTGIHPSFAEYFDKIYDQGRKRYEAKRLTGLEEPVPEVLASQAEMHTRLSLALLKNLPLAVRQPVVEGSMSKNVRCLLVLQSLHERYAPGGREELESIQRDGAADAVCREELPDHRSRHGMKAPSVIGGTSIGAGVVTFLTPEGASRAVTELDATEVDGRPILVKPNERHSRKGGGKGLREARIFWDGVPYSTNEGFLRRSFERYGDIIDFDFWRRKDGRSHGMGTCTYSRVDEAEAAIESLNGSTIDGRSILVRKDEKRPGPGPKPAEEEEVLRPARSRGKGNEDDAGDGTKVFWSGVPIGTTEGFLRSQFERVGTIVDFDFWRNQDGSSLGKGTCRFDHFRGAQRALQRLHGYSIDGGIMMLKEDQGGNKGVLL